MKKLLFAAIVLTGCQEVKTDRRRGIEFISKSEGLSPIVISETAYDLIKGDTTYIFYEKDNYVKMAWSADGYKWNQTTVIGN